MPAINIQIEADESGAIKASDNVGRSFQKIGQQGNVTFTQMTNKQREAKDAAQLLFGAVGVQLPRGLEKAIVTNKTFAATMSTAFNASIVLSVVAAVAEMIPTAAGAIDKLRGINEELDKQRALSIQISNTRLGAQGLGDLAAKYQALKVEQSKVGEQAKISGDSFVKVWGVNLPFISDQTKAARERFKELKEIIPSVELALNQAAMAEAAAAANHHRQMSDITAGTLVGFKQVNATAAAAVTEAKALENAHAITHEEAQRRITEAWAQSAAARLQIQRDFELKFRAIRVDAGKVAQDAGDELVAQRDATMQIEMDQQQKARDQQLAYLNVLIDADTDYEVTRRQMNGDAVGALIVQENARVEAALSGLRQMNASEEELASARERLQKTADAHIAAEYKNTVQQMGSEYESVFDDMFNGNLGKRILSNAKKLFFQIFASWVQTTRGSGGGGGFGGLLGTLIFGPGSTGAGGASSIGGIGGIGGGGVGTPPFVGGGSSGGSVLGSVLGGGILGGLGSGGGIIGGGTSAGGSNLLPSGSAVFNRSTGEIVVGGGGGSSSGGGTLSTIRASLGKSLKGGLGAALPLVAMGLAGKAGGTPAMLGAGLASIGALAAAGNPGAMALVSSLGLSPAVLAGGAGGLIGFGVGMQHGKLAGSVTGAAAGLGTAGILTLLGVGLGPVGWAIAGIVGLLGGLFGGVLGGSKRKKQAASFVKTEEDEVSKLLKSYESFQTDYATTMDQLNQIAAGSQQQLGQLKGEGRDAWQHDLSPFIDHIRAQIDRDENERKRRMGLVFGPAEFASGGYTGDMPSWMPAGIVHGREGVLNAPAMASLGKDRLKRLNSGESVENIARSSSSVSVHLNVSAIDAKSFSDALRNGGLAKAIKSEMVRMSREGW
jgi:hypothetical protein